MYEYSHMCHRHIHTVSLCPSSLVKWHISGTACIYIHFYQN